MSSRKKPKPQGYVVRNVGEVEPVPCPCGWSTRIINRTHTDVAALHVTAIRDSERHYHRGTTELYYVLEGTGKMELGEERKAFEVRPGMAIYIPPGVPHRGYGEFKTIVVSVPPVCEEDIVHCQD
jgi:mannose-6-phosphate isomerase-like protein (cupin superfamily)